MIEFFINKNMNFDYYSQKDLLQVFMSALLHSFVQEPPYKQGEHFP